jgi:hypothetical protein
MYEVLGIGGIVFQSNHYAALTPVPVVRYGMVDSKSLPTPTTCAKLTELLAMFKDDIGRIDFSDTWRPFTSLGTSGQLIGPPCSKLQKLTTALRYQLSHVEDQGALEAWLVKVAKEIQVRGLRGRQEGEGLFLSRDCMTASDVMLSVEVERFLVGFIIRKLFSY